MSNMSDALKELGMKITTFDPDANKEPHPHLTTGIDVLDELIGGPDVCPGVPLGCLTQFLDYQDKRYAQVIAMYLVKTTLKAGKRVLWIHFDDGDSTALSDTEIKGLLNMDGHFDYVEPNKSDDQETLRECFKYAWVAAVIDPIDLVVFNGAKICRSHLTGDWDTLMWEKFLPQLRAGVKNQGSTAFVGLSKLHLGAEKYNHERGHNGGAAWKFYSQLRVLFRDMPDATDTATATIRKSKVSANFGHFGVIPLAPLEE